MVWSETGTRKMECALCPCSASQAVTLAGDEAATSTSSSRTATHWPMNGRNASTSGCVCCESGLAGTGASGASANPVARGLAALACRARAALKPRRVRMRRA